MFRTMLILAVALAGCQTSSETVRYVRVDGRPVASSPALVEQASRDIAVCKGEGAKAALSAGAVYGGPGLAGAIARDQVVAQQSRQVDHVVAGCMAARGYKLETGQAL